MFERLRARLRGRLKPQPSSANETTQHEDRKPQPPSTLSESPTAVGVSAVNVSQQTAADSGANDTVIRIDGRRYALNDLPKEVTQLLRDLQRADRVIQLRRDKLRLLSQGRRLLAERLRQGLMTVPEQATPQQQPAPTWTAQVSTG